MQNVSDKKKRFYLKSLIIVISVLKIGDKNGTSHRQYDNVDEL